MSVELTLGCTDSNIMDPLLDGDIEPQGIDLTAVVSHPSKRHHRFFKHQLYDICEVSLASYLSSRTAPEEYSFTAIPVFPNRKFRHAFVYKHADADIAHLGDLAGKKVSTQSWQTTATVWMRGIAAEHYGLDLEAVEWYRRRGDDVDIAVPDRFDIRALPGEKEGDAAGRSPVKDALFSGDLDAAMDPSGSLFHAVVESNSAEFLFEDPLAAERQYFEQTGIHPIMHVIAIRDEILEANPWVAVSVYEAFCEARDRSLARSRSPSRNMTLTWSHLHRLEQERVMGPGEDVWEYGLTEKTRHELNTFITYAYDQGLIPGAYEVEDLFVDQTIDL